MYYVGMARTAYKKTSYHHGDLREALILAGESTLHDLGLQGFTLRECARRAGVSHAAPKHHFENVRGLLTAVATRGFDRLATTIVTHMKSAGADLDDQFFAVAHAYQEFAHACPEHFRIMFRSDLLDMESEAFCEATRQTYVEMTNMIRRQHGEPDLTAADLSVALESEQLLSDILLGWCHVHGYAHLRLEGQLAIVPEALQEQMMRGAASRLGGLIRGG